MVKYSYTTIEEVIKLIDYNKPVFFDTETNGFYGTIELAQFYQEHWEEVLFVNKPDPFLLAIHLKAAHLVMQNAHYDVSTISTQIGSKWLPKDLDCTLLASRLHYCDKLDFDLASLLTYALGYDIYKEYGLDKKTLQKSVWTGVLTKDQEVYGALDVINLPILYNIIKHVKGSYLYELDMLTLKYCVDFQMNGFPVNIDRLNMQYALNEIEIEKLDMQFNVNSPKQVCEVLGIKSSAALVLQTMKLRDGNELAGKVVKARKLLKQQSFMRKFETDDGHIYGYFKPLARSGRLTCSDQNLQQLPRKLKHLFGYIPEQNKVIIYADYAQLELRTICVQLKETKMEELFRAKEDLHAYTSEKLFGPKENYTKQELKDNRQVTKTFNFNLLYGGGAAMAQGILIKDRDIYMPLEEIVKRKKIWHKLWPAITAWQNAGIPKWRAGMLNQTLLGRKYKAKLLTDYLNIQNQGAGAEVTKLALHYLYKYCLNKEKYKEVKLINFIHDSYLISCPADINLYTEVSDLLAKCMQIAWYETIKESKISDLPMPVDVLVGYNWGDMEEGEIIYKYELEGSKYLGEVLC